MTRTSLKKYASRTRQQLAPLILKLHYNAHLAPIRISHPQRSMSHPFASRTTFAYSLTLRPAHLAPAATRTPIRISHHIRLFFNVMTRASRTRSNSHPIRISHPATPHVAPIRISHHIRLFFNVMTRASRTRSNSHPYASRTHNTASRTTFGYSLTL